MKFLRRLLAFMLVIITFVGSYIGSFQLFSSGTYEYDKRYLTTYEEDGSYYLKKAPKDIKFCVSIDSEAEGIGFLIVDSEGNNVASRTEKISEGIYNIIPPKEKYLEGERYIITLAEGTQFQDEYLKNVRKLEFYIEREEVEEYIFADNVIQTENVLTEIDENTVDISGLIVESGKVVIGRDRNGKNVVYKIDEINKDGTATVSIPAVDEIYSDLNIYGEYEFDVEELVANSDLNIEIAENFKQSAFFENLVMEAYAAPALESVGVEVKCIPHPAENTIEVEMKITLDPQKDQKIFGVKMPDKHSVVITLNPKINVSADCNIQGLLDWDVAAIVTSTSAWNVQIVNTLGEFEDDTDVTDAFSDTKLMKAINEKIAQLNKDSAKAELKLFDWDMPVAPVPGLVFSAEIKVQLEASLAVNLTVGFENTTVYTVGVRFTDYKFNQYSSEYCHGRNVNITLQGKAEVKAGIVLEIQVALFNEKIAYINIDPQIGGYVEAYVVLPLAGPQDKKISGYVEGGVYLSANINAFINFRKTDYKDSFQLVEVKFPLVELGNKEIPIEIISNAETVRALNNQIVVPDIYFESFDITTGFVTKEKIEYKDLKFALNDGTPLKISGGKITIPSTVTSGTCFIKVTYISEEQKVYTAVFKVMISGCILEGKVSTYTDENTTKSIEGAVVKIFGKDDNTSFTNTVSTDENGRFAFNVQEGDYYLEITADGYHKLTSNQHVTKDEIKYTEHILLMDSAQQGYGKAGGTINDALTGRGLSGIQIRLREDWNNQNGSYVEGFETVTNSNGSYSITNIPIGYYTVEASKEGYVTGYTNIMVLSANQKMDYDFTITPLLDNDEIRIVLSWGETPRDLDSHLIGRTPSDGTFNIYYRDKIYRYEGREMANLDVDDTTSYGPETITILENIYGTYTYVVHDYTNKSSSSSDQMSFSNAVVRVVTENGQVAEFHVPTDRVGTYWTVFEIDGGGNIVPINTVSNTKPAA